MKNARANNLVELSSGTPITKEHLEEKLAALQTSLQVARAQRAEHLKQADALQVQVQMHLGAIQTIEGLLRTLLPEVGEDPDQKDEES